MKDAGREVSHECWNDNLAGLAAEGALVSAQVPSLHQHRFQTGRIASVRWLACVVLSASGAMQILLAASAVSGALDAIVKLLIDLHTARGINMHDLVPADVQAKIDALLAQIKSAGSVVAPAPKPAS